MLFLTYIPTHIKGGLNRLGADSRSGLAGVVLPGSPDARVGSLFYNANGLHSVGLRFNSDQDSEAFAHRRHALASESKST